jgi:hypothetical protein
MTVATGSLVNVFPCRSYPLDVRQANVGIELDGPRERTSSTPDPRSQLPFIARRTCKTVDPTVGSTQSYWSTLERQRRGAHRYRGSSVRRRADVAASDVGDGDDLGAVPLERRADDSRAVGRDERQPGWDR